MVDGRGDLCLFPEALDHAGIVQQLSSQELDRETLPGVRIDRREDFTHPPFSERLVREQGSTDLEALVVDGGGHDGAILSPIAIRRPEWRATVSGSMSTP